MKTLLEKPSNRKLAMGAVAACVACAAVALLTRVPWLGAIFCVLFALQLLLGGGKVALLAEAALTAAFALCEWLLSDGLSLAFIALGAGMVVTRMMLGAGYKKMESVRTELSRERQRHDGTTLVSAVGQARNLRSYQNDAPIYIKLANRYQLNLCLMVWKLNNSQALFEKLGENRFCELVASVSSAMHGSVRGEDMIYLLNESYDDIQWGSLHIANNLDVEAAVKARVLKAIADLPLETGISLDISATSAMAAPDATPMSLLDDASAGE